MRKFIVSKVAWGALVIYVDGRSEKHSHATLDIANLYLRVRSSGWVGRKKEGRNAEEWGSSHSYDDSTELREGERGGGGEKLIRAAEDRARSQLNPFYATLAGASEIIG